MEVLRAVPEMRVRLEDMRPMPDGDWRVLYWAEGDDFDRYETAIAADPTIAAYRCLSDLGDRRLYRITFGSALDRPILHEVTMAHDITIVEATMTAERLRFWARYPSREAFDAMRTACREAAMPFEVTRLFEERETAGDGGPVGRYGVTGPQREALLRALEAGYFAVPRETTLEDVAQGLDVSTSALSARLRRGQSGLISNTLASDESI